MTKKTGVTDRRLMITKNSIMMLVLLVVVFVAVFAWYYVNKQVTASGITVKASDPEEVMIAVENNGKLGSWSGSTFNEGVWAESVVFNDKFQFTSDVTSDGKNFIVPAFSSTEDNINAKADARRNGKIVNVNGVPKTGSDVKTNLDALGEGEIADYVKIPFYLRSKNPNIYIKSSAFLAMGAENGESDANGHTDITGNNSARKSSYGNFTSDALVAAMRVSLTGGPLSSVANNEPARPANAEDEKTFVWVPRPDLFLYIPAGDSETDWELVQGITPDTQGSDSSAANYKQKFTRLGVAADPGSTYKHFYYSVRTDSSQNAVGVTLNDSDTTANTDTAYKSTTAKTKTLSNGTVPTLGESKLISDFSTSATEINGYYYYKYYVNVWIEGTDSEARRAMNTGKFSLFLEFGNNA